MVKARKTLQNIIPYQTDKYKQSWRLKLDSNENIYGASASILSAIKNFDAEDISLYPVYGKLIDKIAQKYNLNNDNILLSNGCDEGLSIILNTYLETEDEILSYNPSFSMPQIYAKIIGANIKLIEYDEKFVFNIEKIKNNISDKTKIVYLATPDNPTGCTVKASVVEMLLKEFPNTLFIIDCTYINFAYSVAFEDYIDLVHKYNNVAILKSFSKDFALAGLRLGFCVADSEIIENLKKVASPYNVNAIAVNCAIAAMNEEKKFEEIKEMNANSREMLFEGLLKAGFKPYKSEGNFVLCDFGPYSEFYYEKLRKNGVIVRNYSKNSPVSSCLRITVPKPGGVKYILELLNTKDVLIFDLDGVVFDVTDSYLGAIMETYKHFSGKETTLEEVMEVKNLGGMNCDWDTTGYLLSKNGIDVELSEVIAVFQDLFYNPKEKNKKREFLIDKEKLLISPDVFDELSRKYDMVVFTGRLKDELIYSLEKYGIDKYFYYFITSDDLPKSMLKPHPKGVLEIIEHCPHKTIKYLGDSVDDIIAGNNAGVDTIGVVSPGADNNLMLNNFRHLGAKYILNDIKHLRTFLKDVEKDYAKNL